MNAITAVAVLVSTAIIFAYCLVIWWLDRYEREPFWLVLLAFAWGGLGGTSLGCLASIPLAIAAAMVGGEVFGTVFGSVVVAPVVEEITKGLVFPLLLLGRHMDNETDGLIYGAATGLGFAAVENLIYYGAAADGEPLALLVIVFVRTFFSSLVHCISSSLLGMCIGYAIHRDGSARWILWPAIGLVLAVVNHAVWNGLATAGEFGLLGDFSAAFILLGMLLVAAASVLMFVLTQISLGREHAVIRAHLLREAGLGILPAAHAEIIPYWTRRSRKGWLPPHVPRDRYIRAATLLAFRHHQREIARGERAVRYAADIERYRGEVIALLVPAATVLAGRGPPPLPTS
jgi:RsiW-degrading membrane proteinase PrsW (M82 family)